jgi:leader peptidase (prepilin peptidase)/N-methyltransferase
MQDLGGLAQPAVFPWVALVVGLCVGSFLNVVIHRLPKMMEREWRADCAELLHGDAAPPEGDARPAEGRYNLFTPRSSCPGCSRPIAPWENIPLLSWAMLQGRCKGCGNRISLRYPLVELLAGLGAAWAAAHFGFGAAAAAGALFIWCTIALAFIDQATGYLPDDITLPLMWAGLMVNVFGTFVPLQDAVIGAAAGYLSLWLVFWAFKLITGKEGMGYGDFKMNAAVGAFVGWQLLPLVVLVSAVVGLAFGAAQMLARLGRWDGDFRFHFGPYLAIAGIVALFWGRPIVAWYLGR